MNILAIDQSSKSCGVSLFVDGKLFDYWLIKPKSSKRADTIAVEEKPHQYDIIMPEEKYSVTLLRSTVITDQIEKLIEQYDVDVVYFEEIFMNTANPKSFRSLARLQGLIARTCWTHRVRYVIVEESKWINHIGTYGRGVTRAERKTDVMKKMSDLYGFEIKVDDISDSLAIGTYAVSVEK